MIFADTISLKLLSRRRPRTQTPLAAPGSPPQLSITAHPNRPGLFSPRNRSSRNQPVILPIQRERNLTPIRFALHLKTVATRTETHPLNRAEADGRRRAIEFPNLFARRREHWRLHHQFVGRRLQRSAKRNLWLMTHHIAFQIQRAAPSMGIANDSPGL